MSQGKSDTTADPDIVQELEQIVYRGGPVACARAAGEINLLRAHRERLRKAFLDDCICIGYSEDEARQMLAEVESGK